MPPRLAGVYALTCMGRDGVVYGYSPDDQIAQRTGRPWRPGPGAVYPALQHLTERGFATVRGAGRRREYRITLLDRRLLRKVRWERLTTPAEASRADPTPGG
jgi:DNA-binding PadR family transcriptional regulator